MKLLVITNNPNRASFRQRIANYFEVLNENGIKCEVVKLPRRKLARIKLFKKTADYDGVLLQKKL